MHLRPQPHTPRLPTLALWLAWALSLVLWQGYAQVHGVVHAPVLHAAHDRAHDHSHGHDHAHDTAHAHDHTPLVDLLAALVDGHIPGSDCRLLDASGHCDALPTLPTLALPALLSSWALHRFTGEVTARWAALFDARGPPNFR